MRYNAPGAGLCVVATLACAGAQPRTLTNNLSYRLSRGDLLGILPAPPQGVRALRIEQGADALLQDCLANPQKWADDSLLFRFGHRQPLSTISCRERATPSMHVVFYPKADGSREAWIHFDLHGPRNPLGHLTEVLRNRLTIGRTSQYDVYRSFIEHSTGDDQEPPPRRYDLSAHALDYMHATFGPSAIAGSMFSATASSVFSHSSDWGRGSDRYVNRFEADVVRHSIRESIEFGAGALLQQDQHFTASGQEGMGRRIRWALYHSFFVPGRSGNEFAFPRVAAALGTGWAMHEWHPWQQNDPNPWLQTTGILSGYVLHSFWREFEPDIRFRLKSITHRAHSATPSSAPESTGPIMSSLPSAPAQHP